jgi:hypothetical protein
MENDKHGLLRATIGVICDDLKVVQAEGTSLLVACVVEIIAWARALERNAPMPASFDPSRLLAPTMGTSST